MTEQEIHDICKKYKIKNYTINPDGSIDVEGDVWLYNMKLCKIPIKFNRVSRIFSCSRNFLTTLENSPIEVGSFHCNNNNLTTLEGGPKIVNDDLDCGFNKLTSLKGSPGLVRGLFNCQYNKLTSLEGHPTQLGEEIYCKYNPLETLEGYNLPYDKLMFNHKEKLIRKHKLKILEVL